jgi:ParB family chromosome partitioning protein
MRSGLNVRQTEELVKNIAESSKELQKIQKSAPRNSEIIQIENNLISKFGTKVVIQKKRGGKGKIQIEFYSENDLQRILDILTDT